ncbi:MAG: STAS domain-containing protein [Actinobacteria bacterium]|nr:STAS domain-containing protein [Actinomycetota bacterium]
MSGDPTQDEFTAHGAPFRDEWHVTVRGELDQSTRGLLVLACLEGGARPVVVDLSAVSFMDAAGFGGLVTARAVIAMRGASLAVRNATGAADRLLELLEASEPALGGYWSPRLDQVLPSDMPIERPGDGAFGWAE